MSIKKNVRKLLTNIPVNGDIKKAVHNDNTAEINTPNILLYKKTRSDL